MREPRRRARGSCPRKRAPFNDSIVNPQPGRFTAAGPGEGRRGTTDPRRMRRARQGSNAHRGACLVEPQLAQGPPPVPVPGTSRRRVVSFSLGWHTVTVTARHQALVAHTPLGYIGMYILSAYVCKCVCYECPRLHRPRRLFNTSHERTDGCTERTDGRTLPLPFTRVRSLGTSRDKGSFPESRGLGAHAMRLIDASMHARAMPAFNSCACTRTFARSSTSTGTRTKHSIGVRMDGCSMCK